MTPRTRHKAYNCTTRARHHPHTKPSQTVCKDCQKNLIPLSPNWPHFGEKLDAPAIWVTKLLIVEWP